MITQPILEERKLQPYAAIRIEVPMMEIPEKVPPLIPEVISWLENNKIAAAGPPFFEYHCMTKSGVLIIDAGVPVNRKIKGDKRVKSGNFPAGKYAVLTHLGHYTQLKEAHMALEDWIRKNGWDDRSKKTGQNTEWNSRTEFYLTDAQKEPDSSKWRTDIAFLLEPKR
jgi:effector-binding domain-containing protein